MGYGDWIIATGQVREMFARRKIPVIVVGSGMKPQWSEVFDHNPKILRRPTMACQTLLNGSGARPYIAGKSNTHWTWRPFKPPRGELFFSEDEKVFGSAYGLGRVMIEPTVKRNTHDNKAWPVDRWQALVDSMLDVRFVQCGPDPSAALRGVEFVVTQRFRQACAVLSNAIAFVGTEGGLMHAAAAVDTPAVILWSEFIDPGITGYANHRNIRHVGKSCGSRMFCPTCRESMEKITVEEVRENLVEVIK